MPILGGTSKVYEESLQRQKAEITLLDKGGDLRSREEFEGNQEGRFLSSSFLRAWFYGQNKTIELCNEMCDTRSLSFHTSTLLHHGDPYLKMGPFKYELLSNDPHVAIFRDIFSRSECDDFIQRARHDLHSTPYQVGLNASINQS